LIGRFSALACSNSVYITSYYEGIAYYYVMVKSGNTITTNLLMEKPTTEKNGVEVSIKNVYSFKRYEDALKCITFFPNIYIDGRGYSQTKINDIKIKKFNNFAAASATMEHKILLGNVLYPIDKSKFTGVLNDFLWSINNTGIVLKFNVGDLSITPNREEVIYNGETIEKIADKIKAAKQELEGLITSVMTLDYDDIFEYCNTMSNNQFYDPIENKIEEGYSGYKIDFNIISNYPKYKGKDLKEYVSFIGAVLRMQLPKYVGTLYQDKFYNLRLPSSVYNYNQIRTPNLLLLNQDAKLTATARLYIRDNFNKIAIAKDIPLSFFRIYAKEVKTYLPNAFDVATVDFIVEAIYEAYRGNATSLDLNNNEDFKEYKECLADERKLGKDTSKIKETIVYIHSNRIDWRDKKVFRTMLDCIKYLKGLQSGIVLCNMDVPTPAIKAIMALKGYILVTARRDVVADIKKLNPSFLVDLDWILNKDPMLSVVKTILKYFPYDASSYQLYQSIEATVKQICKNVDKIEAKEFEKLLKIWNTFCSNYDYRAIVKRDSIPYDAYTEYLCTKLKNYIIKHRKAAKIVDVCSDERQNSLLTAAVIMKTKAYRINGETYKKIHNNQLLRVLCRK
jgi:hypothetical protein